MASLGTVLLCSICYNFYQFTANSRLSDNDIKFRYIKAFGEITPENLLKLKTIFEYEPDKQKQRSLHRMVEEHEQREPVTSNKAASKRHKPNTSEKKPRVSNRKK